MNSPEADPHATLQLGPHSARQILRLKGLRPRKKLGQNFLVDPNVARKLIRMLAPRNGEVFLEIGAGIGALTLPLAERGVTTFAVEIDPKLSPLLRAVVGRFENVRLLERDILHVEIAELLQEAGVNRIHVLGNLPYNITTQIVLYLIENRRHIGRVLITVQREYAERLLAKPGTRLYGSMSVLAQFYSTIENVMTISPTCFFPEPDVSSSVLKLVFREKPATRVKDETVFRAVVRAAFAHRRKMLLNSIAEWLGLGKPKVAALLDAVLVDSAKRAEQLTLEELARIADVFYGEKLPLSAERVPRGRSRTREIKIERGRSEDRVKTE
jgi:16S rRNA (adenine1518-N6/adenine1519-N6)-dimethyltransferase